MKIEERREAKERWRGRDIEEKHKRRRESYRGKEPAGKRQRGETEDYR
jgi:hypothetical protein